MTLSKNANEFDSIEVNKALDEHSDAWRAWNRMANRELRSTSAGNKWGCDEKVRYNRAVTVLLQLGHTAATIAEIESEVI